MTLEQEIGRHVTRGRGRLGLTQGQLGERIGALTGRTWTRKAVLAAEKGDRVFTAREMVALAELFKVPIEALFRAPCCEACGDRPPSGFTCNDCGATNVRVEAS
jgi:DNA-binding XRE family transcriptional regulator